SPRRVRVDCVVSGCVVTDDAATLCGGAEPCGCSSMVEPQSSKLVVRVRFSSPAPRPASLACKGNRSQQEQCWKRDKTPSVDSRGLTGRRRDRASCHALAATP